MCNPCTSHFTALTHTLRYVAHSIGQGILLKANADIIKLQTFTDSDRAACPDSRKSITGYVLLLGQAPTQSTISRSSTESEYRAIAAASSKVTWLVRLLEELSVSNHKPVTLFCDNQYAIHIAKNPIFQERQSI